MDMYKQAFGLVKELTIKVNQIYTSSSMKPWSKAKNDQKHGNHQFLGHQEYVTLQTGGLKGIVGWVAITEATRVVKAQTRHRD